MESFGAPASLPEFARQDSPGHKVRQSPLLQALRGMAALDVAIAHIGEQAGALAGRTGEPAYAWLHPLAQDVGVDVFFVISGVVMVWSSLPLFGQPGAARRFAVRRLARVVPLYWIATLLLAVTTVVLPALVSEPTPSLALVLTSFLFLPWRRSDGLIQPLFRLGWTLNYEMLFYAIFTVFVGLPARWAMSAVLASVLSLAVVGWTLHPVTVLLVFWTDPIVLEFGMGVVLAALSLRLRLGIWWRVVLALVGLAGLAAADLWTATPRGIAYGLPCAAMVAAAILGPIRPARSRAMRALVGLGDVSYALYLVHPFAMRALAFAWLRTGFVSRPGVLCYVALTTAASIVLAAVVHARLERKLTAWARRLGAPAVITATNR